MAKISRPYGASFLSDTVHTMKHIIAILGINTFFIGLLAALVKYELILWQGIKHGKTEFLVPYTCKNVSLFYIKNKEWKEEKVTIAWQHTQEAVELVTKQLLDLLLQEKCISKKVSLQSALLDIHEQCIYISFEQSLFERQQTTEQKIAIISSFCKTIAALGIGVQKCFFLINHQPMKDYHLDFNFSWPIHYYVELLNVIN